MRVIIFLLLFLTTSKTIAQSGAIRYQENRNALSNEINEYLIYKHLPKILKIRKRVEKHLSEDDKSKIDTLRIIYFTRLNDVLLNKSGNDLERIPTEIKLKTLTYQALPNLYIYSHCCTFNINKESKKYLVDEITKLRYEYIFSSKRLRKKLDKIFRNQRLTITKLQEEYDEKASNFFTVVTITGGNNSKTYFNAYTGFLLLDYKIGKIYLQELKTSTFRFRSFENLEYWK